MFYLVSKCSELGLLTFKILKKCFKSMVEKAIFFGRKIILISSVLFPQKASMSSYSRKLIGKRDIVGNGFNGEPIYIDRSDYPIPAIRWKETTKEILALREKEKGDWNKLTLAEKKALYRASFCQTFSEFSAPTGEWKSVIGFGLLFISMSLWMFYGVRAFSYGPLPDSFCQENREAQLARIIDAQMNPIQGISSKWDYDKDYWKK